MAKTIESSPFIEKNEIIKSIGITAISCIINIPKTLLPWGLFISFVSLNVFKTIAVEDKDRAVPMINETCVLKPNAYFKIKKTKNAVTTI